MYHIKDDRRAFKSSELIYQSLIQCMQEKEFSKITVTDIQKTSGVGRATFYRHFDRLTDVLYWKCNQQFFEVLNSYVAQHPYPDEKYALLLHVFGYWVDNSEIIEQLLSIGRMDILFECFFENSHVVTNHFKAHIQLPDSRYDYFMAIRIGIFISILITWMGNGKQESAEELVDILAEQLAFIEKNPVLL